jgi:hypothetical protein
MTLMAIRAKILAHVRSLCKKTQQASVTRETEPDGNGNKCQEYSVPKYPVLGFADWISLESVDLVLWGKSIAHSSMKSCKWYQAFR